MKRILLSFLVAFVAIISVQAFCISRTFLAYDDGEYYGKIVLQKDSRFVITTVDDEYFTGTYDIKSDEGHQSLQSGSSYKIVFNVSDGPSITCNYHCPVYGKQCIVLDGFTFEAQ